MKKQLKELMQESLKYESSEDFIQSMRLPAMLKADFKLGVEVSKLSKELKKLPPNKFADKGIDILEKNVE